MDYAPEFKGRAPVPARLIQQERLELVQWLAFFAMVCDHIAILIFPKLMFLRMIGRTAFPMFAFVFAWRLAYSMDKNPNHNLLPMGWKLLASGIVAQFLWIFLGESAVYNIMFVFLTCVIAIALTNEDNPFHDISSPLRWAFSAGLLFFAGPHLDYGYLGLTLILGTYGFFRWGNVESLVFAMISYFALDYNSFTNGTVAAGLIVLMVLKSPYCVSKKIPNFFYWAYPAHLVILFVLAVILSALKTFH